MILPPRRGGFICSRALPSAKRRSIGRGSGSAGKARHASISNEDRNTPPHSTEELASRVGVPVPEHGDKCMKSFWRPTGSPPHFTGLPEGAVDDGVFGQVPGCSGTPGATAQKLARFALNSKQSV